MDISSTRISVDAVVNFDVVGFLMARLARFIAVLAICFGFCRGTDMDHCREEGFDSVGRDYVSWLESGVDLRYAIYGNGDLLLRRVGKLVGRRALLPTLVAPSWIDSQSGGPRT